MPISPRTKQALRWVPAVLFVIAVLFLSTQNVPRMRGNTDKLLHFLVYGIMSVLVFWPLSRNGHRYPYVLSVLTALLIGIFDETIQYYNPARVASLKDLLADGLGSWAGGMLSRGILKIKIKNDD
jgi:VanZ family protein